MFDTACGDLGSRFNKALNPHRPKVASQEVDAELLTAVEDAAREAPEAP